MMLRSMLVSVVVSAVSLGAPLAVAEPAATRRIAPPLDLRLGDIRKFIPTEELDTPLDAAIDEVVVRSPRVRSRLPERMPIPRGLGVPDPNRSVPNRSVDDPQETPGAHRMRIGEPGRAL
jgi:hypothetical protein